MDVVSLVNALRPSELALRDFVRPMLNAATIHEMAGLDYGEEVEENRRAIEELLKLKRLPEEVRWPPREVLELTSFGDPDDPRGQQTALSGRPGHAARVFACVVIVRSDDALQPETTLAKLVESALALGPDAAEDAVRFLAWCRQNEPGVWRGDLQARPFLTLGLLLAYLLSSLRKDEEIVTGLAAAVVAEFEAALAEEQPWWPTHPTAEVLKHMAGGEGFRTWRALLERCDKIEAVKPLREWFNND